MLRSLLLLSFLLPAPILAQTAAQQAPTADTSVIGTDGTARVTRVIRVPPDLSPEASARISRPIPDKAHHSAPGVGRAGVERWEAEAGKRSAAVYPVKITDSTLAGVPVRLIDPLPGAKVGPVSGAGSGADPLHYSVFPDRQSPQTAAAAPAVVPVHADHVLICLHGGGMTVDAGSYTEAIPVANLTRTRVVSVLYRLSPEHTYPAAVEDAVEVYRALLKTYKPQHMAIFGTSAGAILTGEVAVRLKQLGLPEPGALGVFSGFGDMTEIVDSNAMYALEGLSGHLDPPPPNPDHHSIRAYYTGTADPAQPVLSPIYADLHGLPPTLFLTSSRDMHLSGTANMERAWLRDGVPCQMVLFDGLPHAFWNIVELPESREAFATMARFFNAQLGQ